MTVWLQAHNVGKKKKLGYTREVSWKVKGLLQVSDIEICWRVFLKIITPPRKDDWNFLTEEL